MRRDGLPHRRSQGKRGGSGDLPIKSGLVLWLDNTLVTTNGGLVTAWPDLSGLGNDGAQSNPVFQGDLEALGWNGSQPSVLLNGETSGEHLTFDAGTLPASLSGNDQPYTITLACQITTNPTSDRFLLGAGASGSDNQFIDFRVSSTDRYASGSRDDAASAFVNNVEAVSSFDTSRHQFTLHFDGVTRTLYKDGVSIATNATALGQCTFNRFTLGRLRRLGLDEGINFRTPGMTVYSRALSSSELVQLWQWNRDHFGGLP